MDQAPHDSASVLDDKL